MKTMEMSLEDIFLKITMGEGVAIKEDDKAEASDTAENTENTTTDTQDNEKEGEK